MTLEELHVLLTANAIKFNSAFSSAAESVTLTNNRLAEFGAASMKAGALFSAAAGLVIAPAALMLRQFAQVGSATSDMADRLGVSTEAISRFEYVASQTGTSVESFQTAFRKMLSLLTGDIAESSGTGQALREIGLSVEYLRTLSPEGMFQEIAGRIADIQDPAQRGAVAIELFGRSALELMPALAQGSDAFAAMSARAGELGLVMSSATAQAGDTLDDKMQEIGLVLRSVAVAVGEVLAPKILDLLNSVEQYLVSAREWVRMNGETVQTIMEIAVWVGGVGIALLALGGTIAGVQKIVAVSITVWKGLRTAILAVRTALIAVSVASAAAGAAMLPFVVVASVLIAALASVLVENLLDMYYASQEAAENAKVLAENTTEAGEAAGESAGKFRALMGSLHADKVEDLAKVQQEFTDKLLTFDETLRTQQATWGMTERAAERYKLQMLALKAMKADDFDVLRVFEKIDAAITDLERRESFKKLSDQIKTAAEQFREQIATFGFEGPGAALASLIHQTQQAALTLPVADQERLLSQLREARDLAVELDRMEQDKKASQEWEQHLRELDQEAERLRQSLRTPFEEFEVQLAKYDEMLREQIITWQEYEQAVQQAFDKFAQAESKISVGKLGGFRVLRPAFFDVEALAIGGDTDQVVNVMQLQLQEQRKVPPLLERIARNEPLN